MSLGIIGVIEGYTATAEDIKIFNKHNER